MMGREFVFFATCHDIVWIGDCLPLARLISCSRGLGQEVFLLLGLCALTVFNVCTAFLRQRAAEIKAFKGSQCAR